MFQTAEGLLISGVKFRSKTAAILLTVRKSAKATELSRAATESVILFQARQRCADSFMNI
jgi:hypothetical protein